MFPLLVDHNRDVAIPVLRLLHHIPKRMVAMALDSVAMDHHNREILLSLLVAVEITMMAVMVVVAI